MKHHQMNISTLSLLRRFAIIPFSVSQYPQELYHSLASELLDFFAFPKCCKHIEAGVNRYKAHILPWLQRVHSKAIYRRIGIRNRTILTIRRVIEIYDKSTRGLAICCQILATYAARWVLRHVDN